MTDGLLADLRAALEVAVDELGGVERIPLGDIVELRHGGRPFARLGAASAAFRLDRVIAGAALRTPDTAPSPLGPDWLEFAPTEMDRFALDRALAWLEAAWRRSAPAART